MDTKSLKLFDHVIATYLPPERERQPQFAEDVGKRSLFQVGGRISQADRQGHIGDLAMMPREFAHWPTFIFHHCPISHLVDIEPAPPGAGDYRHPDP